MGQIIKFPAQAARLGYRRVKNRRKPVENPDQLDLFPAARAQILYFSPDLTLFEQALLWDERGDERAIELYGRAIEAQDCVADAYCNLGIIGSQKADTAKAFDCFTTALKHDPRHLEAHYNLGNLYFELDDFRLAQTHYELAAAIDPSFANLYFNLGLVRAINNDVLAAISALTKYQELAPADEAQNATELLGNLKGLLAANRNNSLS